MPEYLVQVDPATPYVDTGFVVSSITTVDQRSDVCKEATFTLLEDVGTPFENEKAETCKITLLKEQSDNTNINHGNWINYSKYNVTDEKRPVTYNNFVHTSTDECKEIVDNIKSNLHTRPIFTLDSSVKNKKNSSETKNMAQDVVGSPTEVNALTSNSENADVRFEHNEFSDHSDTESFARLSESVFEAIEDTRDSLIDDQHTPEETGVTSKTKSSKRARTCPICGKTYTASSSYFYHLKHFHKSSKEHGCDVCGKRFGTRADLTQHATVHTTECKFACRSCDKRFRSRASRYIHEQIHDGVKSHKCPRCEKCFRWRTHLQRHMSRHAAEKKHECEVCGRGFSVHCDLLRHARTHAVGSYECDRCRVKFAQMRYLKAHVKKKHSFE